jgi:hypothetical protein
MTRPVGGIELMAIVETTPTMTPNVRTLTSIESSFTHTHPSEVPLPNKKVKGACLVLEASHEIPRAHVLNKGSWIARVKSSHGLSLTAA